MQMKRLDDIATEVTRAECMLTITMRSCQRDLDTCIDINEAVAFDTDTITALCEKADEIGVLVDELRCDMRGHVNATGRAWLCEGTD
jgi:hypothetical protein